MRDQAVRVVARVVARPGKEDELRTLLRGLIEPTRGEPGYVTYELLQNKTDPTDFTFVEEWSSDADQRVNEYGTSKGLLRPCRQHVDGLIR